jgi:hypothetical protein
MKNGFPDLSLKEIRIEPTAAEASAYENTLQSCGRAIAIRSVRTAITLTVKISRKFWHEII